MKYFWLAAFFSLFLQACVTTAQHDSTQVALPSQALTLDGGSSQPSLNWDSESLFWLNHYHASYYTSDDYLYLSLEIKTTAKWSFLQDHSDSQCARVELHKLDGQPLTSESLAQVMDQSESIACH